MVMMINMMMMTMMMTMILILMVMLVVMRFLLMMVQSNWGEKSRGIHNFNDEVDQYYDGIGPLCLRPVITGDKTQRYE